MPDRGYEANQSQHGESLLIRFDPERADDDDDPKDNKYRHGFRSVAEAS